VPFTGPIVNPSQHVIVGRIVDAWTGITRSGAPINISTKITEPRIEDAFISSLTSLLLVVCSKDEHLPIEQRILMPL
jgi:hypothetical protein